MTTTIQKTEPTPHQDDSPPLVPAAPGQPAENPVPGTENDNGPSQSPAVDALAEKAEMVAKELRGCAAAVRRASNLIKQMMDTCDRQGRRSFLEQLAARRVIPAAEADLDRHGSTVRKQLEIASADWLDRPELEEFLPIGYSPLYHLVLLYKALPKSSAEERLRRLISILATAEGAITRQWLISAKKNLGGEGQSQRTEEETVPPPNEAGSNDEDEGDNKVDLLVLTPGLGDLKWLKPEYSLSYLGNCLQLLGRTDEEGLGIVISATFADLTEIFKLLNLCGFKKPKRILIPQLPACSDANGIQVVVVADRGAMRMTPIGEGEWLADGDAIDLTKIAERLFPNATRKLHAFTDAQTEGWASLTSAKTWNKEPTLND